MNLNWVPDAIPLSFFDLILVFYHLFFYTSDIKQVIENSGYYTLYGYSCRSLWEIFLKSYPESNVNYLISPLHHTSWKNLIEKYIDPEKIKILELNNSMNGLPENISQNPEMIEKLEKTDIVILTHLFGQDFDLSILADLKEKYDFIIIEDRVQGGSVDKPFSHPCVDMSFYSMGMDKRPCSLGGGYVNINKHCKYSQKILDAMLLTLNGLPHQSKWARFTDLIKKIPTYAIYSYQSVTKMTSWLLSWRGMDLPTAVQFYRQKNPGFSHHNYMWQPHPSLQSNMIKNKLNYKPIEKRMRKRYGYFYTLLKLEYIPWFRRYETPLTMYNTIYIPPDEINLKLAYFQKHKMAYLPNPTWKVLSQAPTRYHDFSQGLVYLPCLYHMKPVEINYLSSLVNAKVLDTEVAVPEK